MYDKHNMFDLVNKKLNKLSKKNTEQLPQKINEINATGCCFNLIT